MSFDDSFEKDPQTFKTKSEDPVKKDAPTGAEVTKFHTNADVDGSKNSMHHTLGSSNTQASPGDHDHRGGTSVELLLGTTISGSKSSGAALDSIIAVLVELGATDSTTA